MVSVLVLGVWPELSRGDWSVMFIDGWPVLLLGDWSVLMRGRCVGGC